MSNLPRACDMPKYIHYLVILVLIEHAQYSLQNFAFKKTKPLYFL